MKKLILLLSLLASVCVAQVPAPKTTSWSRKVLGNEDLALRMYTDSFRRYIAFENFDWGTNGCLLPLGVTWASKPAYSWTMPTGAKAFVTGTGVTNLVITNGMLSTQFTNSYIPNIYITMAVSNRYKYFIVGEQFQVEWIAGPYGQTTNYCLTAPHFGPDCYWGNFTRSFHNTGLNTWARLSGITCATNTINNIWYPGNVGWDGTGTPWGDVIVTNMSFVCEIGYIDDVSTAANADKVVFCNFNGFLTNFIVPNGIFTNSYAVGPSLGTNFTIQINHESWVQQYRIWLDKMWIRVPGNDGFSAPAK